MDEVNRQLKKGMLEILILKLLSLESLYGYQLIQELDQKSQGIFKTKEGTLYPVLYRLEDNKYIEGYWEQEQKEKRGVPRKYYRITLEGLGELTRMIDELRSLLKGIRAILNEEGI